jgi:hypothetical protein
MYLSVDKLKFRTYLPSGNLLHSIIATWQFLVDLPIKHVFFLSYVSLPEGTTSQKFMALPKHYASLVPARQWISATRHAPDQDLRNGREPLQETLQESQEPKKFHGLPSGHETWQLTLKHGAL